MEDRRSNPSKEWNVSIPGIRNLGHIENTVRADTHKRRCRKIGRELERGTKEGRELKAESEWKRAGGVTLSLLPNLASESATARRGSGEGCG